MNELIQILVPTLIQASYDYCGWNLWLGEPEKYDWKAILFRIVKETLDFPVTFYICYCSLGYNWKTMLAFYIFKWSGGCDLTYMGIDYLRRKQPIAKIINWMWWTPYSLIKDHKFKAEITREEMLVQVAVGLLIAIILLII